ncbi:hypothetical protein SDC9_154080 [bioreactor metagenome]|uniref:Uncharacterized protein n=1 Tax=bioreactor metagenome TaxID=1076179 RepID=A0A645F2F7_9ZZZZ
MGISLIFQCIVPVPEILNGEVLVFFHPFLIFNNQIDQIGNKNGRNKKHQIFDKLNNRILICRQSTLEPNSQQLRQDSTQNTYKNK